MGFLSRARTFADLSLVLDRTVLHGLGGADRWTVRFVSPRNGEEQPAFEIVPENGAYTLPARFHPMPTGEDWVLAVEPCRDAPA
jgi:hypothetical protein